MFRLHGFLWQPHGIGRTRVSIYPISQKRKLSLRVDNVLPDVTRLVGGEVSFASRSLTMPRGH